MRIFRYTIFSREALLYGKTVHTFVYASDTRKRYVHIYYSAAKAAGERARFGENIQQMQCFLDTFRNEEREFGPTFEKYFFLHRDKSGTIVKKPNYFTTPAAIREL